MSGAITLLVEFKWTIENEKNHIFGEYFHSIIENIDLKTKY